MHRSQEAPFFTRQQSLNLSCLLRAQSKSSVQGGAHLSSRSIHSSPSQALHTGCSLGWGEAAPLSAEAGPILASAPCPDHTAATQEVKGPSPNPVCTPCSNTVTCPRHLTVFFTVPYVPRDRGCHEGSRSREKTSPKSQKLADPQILASVNTGISTIGTKMLLCLGGRSP